MPKKEGCPDRITLANIILPFVLIALLPLILATLIIFGIYNFIYTQSLLFAVRRKWLPTGKNTLFVYSNSPHWKNYIEQNILPQINDRAYVLNWSERNNWDWKRTKSLPVRVYKNWSGVGHYIDRQVKRKARWTGRSNNPLAIVFFTDKKPKVFRFWQPFRDYKHGKALKLKEMEAAFLSACLGKFDP